ncbi:nuclear transport factor 2 family protein [Rhodococcus koreensis]
MNVSPQVSSVEAKLDYLLSEQEIIALISKYCHLCDAREGSAFVREIFTEDGIDDHGLFGKVFQGWDEIETMFNRSSELLEATAHFVTNPEIEINGDTAEARTYVQCWTWLRESAHLGNVRAADYVYVGIYNDSLVRTAEGWRVKARKMQQLGPGALGVGEAHPVYFAAYQRPTAEVK